MKPRTSRRGRLTRSAEFERVYRHGRSCANRYLVLHTFPNADGGQARVGLSVSRRVGGAVERNAVKRALREAVRALSSQLRDGRDLVVAARPEVLSLVQRSGSAGVQEALADLLGRSGGESSDREAAASQGSDGAVEATVRRDGDLAEKNEGGDEGQGAVHNREQRA